MNSRFRPDSFNEYILLSVAKIASERVKEDVEDTIKTAILLNAQDCLTDTIIM
jgi:hypothetical protein